MVNIKKKTQISAFIGEELGEWLREYAFKTRKSESEIIRKMLQVYRSLIKLEAGNKFLEDYLDRKWLTLSSEEKKRTKKAIKEIRALFEEVGFLKDEL